MAHFFDGGAQILKLDPISDWLTTDAPFRNSFFVVLFILFTVNIISRGVKDGIEKWASRLMPSLIIVLILLIFYVISLPGAIDGLRVYLIPDFSQLSDPALLVDAMGQAFFSLSLGVGTMLIYGSYISDEENLPVVGGLVALLDIGIAVIAGLLILPAMYVAFSSGVEIFDSSGEFIAGPGLIVSVLPTPFQTMGVVGIVISLAFFLLMTIASLTSSISMLEVPVSYAIEYHGVCRKRAAIGIGSIV